MASTEEVIATLNNLIQTCRDGREGFETAAEGVANEELRALFRAYAGQRADFVGELEDEVRRMGGEPAEVGSVTGSLHRGWMGIKAAVTGGEESSILAECERGEDSALAAYLAAFGTDVPASVRQVVERQFAEIKEAHHRIRSLEKGTGAGA
jgi:uncharacterized protein (TIGR02284 family)